MDGIVARQRSNARVRMGRIINPQSNHPTLVFSFMAPLPGQELPPTPERFNVMAQQIRTRILVEYANLPEGYLIDFIPINGNTRQIAIRTRAGITGEFLNEMYGGILHSQEGVPIDGFKVFLT